MKKQCPRCASYGKDTRKDNLHVYPDGSCYCFSCKLYIASPLTQENISNQIKKMEETKNIIVPEQETEINFSKLTTKIPSHVRNYLASKYIDPNFRHGTLYWDEKDEFLVYPVHDADGKIVFASCRYFGKNPEHPRYVNKGSYKYNPVVFGEEDKTNVVFVVEDFLSALRIASIKNPASGGGYCAYPMFGSIPYSRHMLKLTGLFLACAFFLDPDKRYDSYKYKMAWQHSFEAVDVVFSPKDPKDLTPLELKNIIETTVSDIERKLFNNYQYDNSKADLGSIY